MGRLNPLNVARYMERVMGIEPTSKAWEAFVLPLNYTREEGLNSNGFPDFGGFGVLEVVPYLGQLTRKRWRETECTSSCCCHA